MPQYTIYGPSIQSMVSVYNLWSQYTIYGLSIQSMVPAYDLWPWSQHTIYGHGLSIQSMVPAYDLPSHHKLNGHGNFRKFKMQSSIFLFKLCLWEPYSNTYTNTRTHAMHTLWFVGALLNPYIYREPNKIKVKTTMSLLYRIPGSKVGTLLHLVLFIDICLPFSCII